MPTQGWRGRALRPEAAARQQARRAEYNATRKPEFKYGLTKEQADIFREIRHKVGIDEALRIVRGEE